MGREKGGSTLISSPLMGASVSLLALLLGVFFLLLRLALVAVAVDMVTSGLLKSPLLKYLPLGVGFALGIVLIGQVLLRVIRQGLAEAVAYLHHATQPTARLFLISVGALLLYLAALLLGIGKLANAIAWLWLFLMTVLLVYSLGYFAWAAWPRHTLFDRVLGIS